MKRIIFFFVVMLMTINHIYAATSEVMVTQLKPKLESLMEKYQIPGMAVELYADGEPYSFYFGFADKNKKIAVTESTIFELGSVTKIITSILLAQEVDRAIVQLTDPLKKFIPEISTDYETVTLKNLATHTAGLPFKFSEKIKTEQDLQNYLKKSSLPFKPNEQWRYSNAGIGLLAQLLEQVTHKNLDRLLQLRIAGPLKMPTLGFNVSKYYQKHYAQGYDKTGKETLPTAEGLFRGAYGLKASAKDMRRFLAAAIGLPNTPPQLFYPIRMTQVAYVQLSHGQQGLGWHIYPINKLSKESVNLFEPHFVKETYEHPVFNGDYLIEKTGATDGFRTYLAVLPNKKSGLILLANKKVLDEAFVQAAREILLSINANG